MKMPTKPIEYLALLGILILIGLIAFPVFQQAKNGGRNICLSRVKQLAMASLFYSEDFDQRLMNRDYWMDAIPEYHKNRSIEHCPAISAETHQNPSLYGYAFNSRLSLQRADEKSDQEKTPLIYDSVNLARNASDPFISLPNPPRVHREGGVAANFVSYLDGHVKPMTVGLPKQ